MNKPIQLRLDEIQNVKIQDAHKHTLNLEEKIERTVNVIKGLLGQGMHLVIAVSMGKDSSVMLNIFLTALKQFVDENGTAPECLVVNSNTRVENPLMDQYSRSELRKVREFCATHNLPVKVEIIEPSLSNNYLVNIIGGRTIAVDSANDHF